MEPPTDEHVTHDPDDAPAELEIIGSHMLESVSVYESTGRLLISLAATATEHAHRHPDDADAQGIAAILTAIEDAQRHPDDPEAAAFLTQAGKHDPRPQRSSGLVGHAERYLRKPPRGPRTRAEQADMLCGTIATGLRLRKEEGWTMRQIAERFVMFLRVAPTIAKYTCVPVTGAWRGTQAEAEAVSMVENAMADPRLDAEGAEAITRAALVALDYPASKAKNVFTHRDKPKSD